MSPNLKQTPKTHRLPTRNRRIIRSRVTETALRRDEAQGLRSLLLRLAITPRTLARTLSLRRFSLFPQYPQRQTYLVDTSTLSLDYVLPLLFYSELRVQPKLCNLEDCFYTLCAVKLRLRLRTRKDERRVDKRRIEYAAMRFHLLASCYRVLSQLIISLPRARDAFLRLPLCCSPRRHRF